jgi:hypothetical protein
MLGLYQEFASGDRVGRFSRGIAWAKLKRFLRPFWPEQAAGCMVSSAERGREHPYGGS